MTGMSLPTRRGPLARRERGAGGRDPRFASGDHVMATDREQGGWWSMPRITRDDAERLLGNVAQENVFWCCDGQVFHSMQEMGQAFGTMTDEVFTYHSNQDKCDFANWARDVIGDAKLARDLAKSQAPTQAWQKVGQRVEFLTAKLP